MISGKKPVHLFSFNMEIFLMSGLWWLQIGLAFMVSTFVSKSTSATNVGFFVFIVGFLTQVSWQISITSKFLHSNVLCLYVRHGKGAVFSFKRWLIRIRVSKLLGLKLYFWRGIFLILQLVTIFGFPYDKKFSTGLRAIWSLFPPNVFAAALNYLGLATSTAQDPGIKWKDRSKCSYRSEDCVLTMVMFSPHPL